VFYRDDEVLGGGWIGEGRARHGVMWFGYWSLVTGHLSFVKPASDTNDQRPMTNDNQR